MSLMENSIARWLALSLAPGMGSVTLARLLARFHSPAGILDTPAVKLADEGLSPELIAALREPDQARIEQALGWAEGERNHLIPMDDPRYPALLKEVADPPALLYVHGDPELLAMPQLAMVGSRNPTRSGEETAREFARHLSRTGLTITSGLAAGIDAASHRGALEGSGLTIAVVGTGLDRVYPAKHRDLAHAIAEKGALVSEFPLGTQPTRGNFPRRNRIISGLSVGTLVVEAALKSGSLITARLAMEQGREVFAIPGSIHNPLARGCHRLIREGAKLVETAEHVLEELAPLVALSMAGLAEDEPAATEMVELDEEYRQMLDEIGFDPTSVDTIVERSGLTAEAVSSMLLVLELQGLVISAPGGGYSRVT